jgi:hypothetical protein
MGASTNIAKISLLPSNKMFYSIGMSIKTSMINQATVNPKCHSVICGCKQVRPMGKIGSTYKFENANRWILTRHQLINAINPISKLAAHSISKFETTLN